MLRQRLTAEMKEAMKAGDKAKLATVRLIQAALKDKDIEARGLGKEPLAEEEIFSLLQKMIKQRNESASVYDQGGRPELARGPPRRGPGQLRPRGHADHPRRHRHPRRRHHHAGRGPGAAAGRTTHPCVSPRARARRPGQP